MIINENIYSLHKLVAYVGLLLVANNVDTGDARGANERVAFRMKSEADVVEDGYKWRKYGKKMVKNSPNPRCA